jgi:cation diffusion facilitator CzcD-associated flavoprotein CzcO
VLRHRLLLDTQQQGFEERATMLDKPAPAVEETNRDAPERWVQAFDAALRARSEKALAQCFVDDSHWRNLFGISWYFATFSGRETLVRELLTRARDAAAADFRIDTALLVPRRAVVAGREVIEAIIRFDTANGPGFGAVRLLPSPGGVTQAWTLSTTLDFDRICADRAGERASISHIRDFAEADWLDRRRERAAYSDRDPDVLVVGGGHAGISAAVELQRIGLSALIVDRQARIGDNWRLRYRGLKLHNKTPVNHLRYLPFPVTFPEYIPKDQIANWLESYVDIMDIDFWARTSFEGASHDDATGRWAVRLNREGTERALHPKHIVLATSVSGFPNIPVIDGIEKFNGEVLHSSAFKAGREWQGRSVVVFGTGTSAHDICQELEASGADVTMVQRSPTMVVNVEPAQIYDRTYLGDGPPLEVRDIVNSGVPLAVMKMAHKIITSEVKALDAPLHARLEQAGFRLEFGEDGTGWPLKFRSRGGGYYFNVGCSELIAEGKIRLIQFADIAAFEAQGLTLKDGSALDADLFVLATGYKGLDHLLEKLFGREVAARVGRVWGFDDATQELRNMWRRTGQPGLWFTGGAFSQARIYSRYIALQIDAIERGVLAKNLS